MWRGSWRLLSQVRRSSNLPQLSRSPSAHLGLQSLRLQSYGSRASGFSTSAEADRAEMEMGVTDDPSVSSASTTPLRFEGEQGEGALIKIVEEHRQLATTLRAELEEQKALTRSILDEIRVITSKSSSNSADIHPPEKKLSWLEWAAFMEHLRDSGYLKDEKSGSSIFEDLTCVKKAIDNFSQAHGSIFESLSQIDLRILARYGSAVSDFDAAASQKRLRQHFHIENILTEDAGDKSGNIQPNLLDVTKLLHCSIVEGTLEGDAKLSISHLLREIITLSRKSSEASPPHSLPLSSSEITNRASQAKVIKSLKPDEGKVLEERIDAKKIDAPLGKGGLKLGRAEARPETTAPSAPEWKCPRCSFMNLDTKHRCMECSRRRPQRTYAANSAKSSDDESLIDQTYVKQARKATEENCSMATEEEGGLKGPSSSLASCGTETGQSSSDDGEKNAEAKDPFDVLDDILDSKDSDEDESSSEESKEVHRGSSKKATSLSGLFTRPPRRDAERRNDSATSERKPFKGGSLLKSRDSNRYRSLGTDEDESGSSDTERSSRKGSAYRDDDRRGGRDRYNRGRGGGGGRGYRGDSYDERRSDRSFRGNREYGDRDRGSRSDNYGGRSSSRGRSRY